MAAAIAASASISKQQQEAAAAARSSRFHGTTAYTSPSEFIALKTNKEGSQSC